MGLGRQQISKRGEEKASSRTVLEMQEYSIEIVPAALRPDLVAKVHHCRHLEACSFWNGRSIDVHLSLLLFNVEQSSQHASHVDQSLLRRLRDMTADLRLHRVMIFWCLS